MKNDLIFLMISVLWPSILNSPSCSLLTKNPGIGDFLLDFFQSYLAHCWLSILEFKIEFRGQTFGPHLSEKLMG